MTRASTALGTFWPTMHFFANHAPDPSGYGAPQYVLDGGYMTTTSELSRAVEVK